MVGANHSYEGLNEMAAKVPVGADGLMTLPFGNGAERMLNNQVIGAQFSNLDFNVHSVGHMVRAVQEGIACSFRYGLDIMRENGINPGIIRVSKANLFRSDVFTRAFAGINNVAIEFYDGDGSFGAAIGAGIGAAIYSSAEAACKKRKPTGIVKPEGVKQYEELYGQWKELLADRLANVKKAGTYSFILS
jgi:xylulokinase